MKFFHERLRSARKMNGLSLEALKDKLDGVVTRQSLHKYETGQMKPDSRIISDLCRILDVRPDYFSKERTVVIEDVSFRKLEKCSKKEQEIVKERTADFLERYLELEELLGVRYDKKNFRQSIKISEKAEIDDEVKKLRKQWNIGNSVLYNVIELLEDLGVKVLLFDADDSFDGLSTWVDKQIPVIVINSKKHQYSKDRLRFTALHELGHLVLNIDDLPEKEQERMCHYFAASMLMPKEVVFFELGENRSSISFRELGLIKKQYGLSIQSLLFRSKDLNIISDRIFRVSYKLLSQYGWRKREPEEFDFEGSEKSNRFDQLLLKGVTEGVLSSSKAASLKNMKLADFRIYLAGTNFSK